MQELSRIVYRELSALYANAALAATTPVLFSRENAIETAQERIMSAVASCHRAQGEQHVRTPMTEKPRRPTDAATIKGFQTFEEGMNVWLAWHRSLPSIEDTDEWKGLWAVHNSYRKLAIAAQKRIDDKREAKENERHDAG